MPYRMPDKEVAIWSLSTIAAVFAVGLLAGSFKFASSLPFIPLAIGFIALGIYLVVKERQTARREQIEEVTRRLTGDGYMELVVYPMRGSLYTIKLPLDASDPYYPYYKYKAQTMGLGGK